MANDSAGYWLSINNLPVIRFLWKPNLAKCILHSKRGKKKNLGHYQNIVLKQYAYSSDLFLDRSNIFWGEFKEEF